MTAFSHQQQTHIAIMGNSGSGKTTLARQLAKLGNISILDLDTIVWEAENIALRRPTNVIQRELQQFCTTHSQWIIEGCYGDLIQMVLKWKPQLIFLNPGEEACIRNCRDRPWEPHKYASKAEQDSHLAYLIKWVCDYYYRDDEMSFLYHRRIFDTYKDSKLEIKYLH